MTFGHIGTIVSGVPGPITLKDLLRIVPNDHELICTIPRRQWVSSGNMNPKSRDVSIAAWYIVSRIYMSFNVTIQGHKVTPVVPSN